MPRSRYGCCCLALDETSTGSLMQKTSPPKLGSDERRRYIEDACKARTDAFARIHQTGFSVQPDKVRFRERLTATAFSLPCYTRWIDQSKLLCTILRRDRFAHHEPNCTHSSPSLGRVGSEKNSRRRVSVQAQLAGTRVRRVGGHSLFFNRGPRLKWPRETALDRAP
jgi:hypothetical protein